MLSYVTSLLCTHLDNILCCRCSKLVGLTARVITSLSEHQTKYFETFPSWSRLACGMSVGNALSAVTHTMTPACASLVSSYAQCQGSPKAHTPPCTKKVNWDSRVADVTAFLCWVCLGCSVLHQLPGNCQRDMNIHHIALSWAITHCLVCEYTMLELPGLCSQRYIVRGL